MAKYGNLMLKFAGADAELKNKCSNKNPMFPNAGQARTNVLSWTAAELCLSRPYFANALLSAIFKIFSFNKNEIALLIPTFWQIIINLEICIDQKVIRRFKYCEQ